MVNSQRIAFLLFAFYLVSSVESRAKSQHHEKFEKFHTVINGKESAKANKKDVTVLEKSEIDQEREDQIRIRSATNLEALLLETINIAGSEICSSSFALSVMLGTWRQGDPDKDEMKHSVELRRICYQALLQEAPATTSIPKAADVEIFGGRSRMLMSDHEPMNSSIHEDLTFTLIQPTEPPMFLSRLSRQRDFPPPTPPKKDSPADPKALKNANEILKDKSADCKPRDVPVDIPREPNITYMPACAMAKRCGGCCKHDSLHCVPIETEILKKKVVAVNNKGVRLEIKSIDIEMHKKCKCDCKVKATDCIDQIQTYDKKNCRCRCKETKKCATPLYWDDRSCKCRCPSNLISECSTSSFFSSDQCRCVTADEIFTKRSSGST